MAGGARVGAAQTRATLAAETVGRLGETSEVFITERAGHARLLAAAAARGRARLVIAWGGDGTINEVASALAFGSVPLGIVPAGSGNGLATELGIDARPDRAIGHAMRAKPQSIDMGELGGRLFVNVAGVGLDAHIASQFNTGGDRRRGFAGYLRVSVRALATYRPATYWISSDGARMTARALLVAVANSAQYGNGAQIAPGARVDDGELDLVVVEERSRFATLCRAPRLFAGTVDRTPGFSSRRVRQATIECDKPMVFHVDGEPIEGGTLLTALVHPGALKICVR